MTDENTDRRVQRTRELLRRALTQLILERGYDAVTIQDITERANLGRTTFYLHYQSKDELLLDHYREHAANSLMLGKASLEQLMGAEPQPETITFLESLIEGKNFYLTVTKGKDSSAIVQAMTNQIVHNLEASLKRAFPDTAPNIPLDMLVQYIAGATISLIDWWVTSRTPYSALKVGMMLHQLQRAAIKEAYAGEQNTDFR